METIPTPQPPEETEGVQFVSKFLIDSFIHEFTEKKYEALASAALVFQQNEELTNRAVFANLESTYYRMLKTFLVEQGFTDAPHVANLDFDNIGLPKKVVQLEELTHVLVVFFNRDGDLPNTTHIGIRFIFKVGYTDYFTQVSVN